MPDWNEIEARYVTQEISYRALAAQYGVHENTVARHGRKGLWAQKRLRHGAQVRAEMLARDKEMRLERIEKLQQAADKLLERVEALSEAADITPANLKTLSETLKNIRDAQMLQQTKNEEKEKQTVTVVLEDVREFTA